MDGQTIVEEIDTKQYLFLKLIGELDLKKNKYIYYNKKTNIVEVSYDNIWEEFQEMLSLTYKKTSIYLKLYIEKHFNLKDITVKIHGENITHKIRTLNEAIESLDINDKDLVAYNAIKDLNIPEHIKSYLELVIITKALNEGWEADWTDGNQKKWYNWFRYDSPTSRFVFIVTNYVTWRTGTLGGSRLCYREESLAAFAANRFSDLYNRYLLYNK